MTTATAIPGATRTASVPAHSSQAQQTRLQLAACYRMFSRRNMDDLIYTHLSARIAGTTDRFLFIPFGMLFDEVKASNLMEVDIAGSDVLNTGAAVNPAGWIVHRTVYEAVPEAQCVMHLHTVTGTAVSAQKDGLLPLDQHAMMISGEIAYHDYEGIAIDLDERDRLVADIGTKNAMILRNHGTLALGKTCADAFLRMFYLERACSMQVRALAGGAAPNWPNQGVPEKTAMQGQGAFNGMIGAMAWPALRRKCDRVDPSYKN